MNTVNRCPYKHAANDMPRYNNMRYVIIIITQSNALNYYNVSFNFKINTIGSSDKSFFYLENITKNYLFN